MAAADTPVTRGEEEAGGPGDGGASGDEGSAVVEFILVGTLLLFLFLGILQVGLILHIRNTLAADAAEGARHAANLGVAAADGGPYAQALIPGRSPAAPTPSAPAPTSTAPAVPRWSR